MELVNDELDTVMEVMTSDALIYLDLIVLSFVFTLLLSPVLQSLTLSILFFFASFGLFSSFYYFIFKRLFKK